MNSKENKMNSNTNSKKIKRTCTCSTCGKTGHNASNKKFHPDYEFTGVSVPTEPKQKIICQQCELFIELHADVENWTGRTTKWVHISEMTICINDGGEDRADQAGEIMNVCFDCVGATDQWGWVEKKDWLKEFGTEDPIAAVAAAKAMCYVDQRDSPNVFPYKKCYECDGRSSCGSYVEDDWICEDCAPEEEESVESDEEIQPHCYKCFNMNMSINVNCFVCDKLYCKSHSYCILGDDDMFYCSKECFLAEEQEKCEQCDCEDDDDSKDLIIIKGAKPEPIPIVVISDNRKCVIPCQTRPMMGRSWWKCLGYDSPCSCAYEAQTKCK